MGEMGMEPATCPVCGSSFCREIAGGVCPRCTLVNLLETPNSETFETGFKVSGLEIHEEIGEGGFGIVYRASETEATRRRVALKILKPGMDSREILRRFEIEQAALALLDHPNIARIYNAGATDRGYPFFTLEYIDGLPITDFLKHRNVEEICRTFIEVCHGVAHAHSKKVIHRDLKPTNILVTEDGSPKIIDFGIAKARDPGTTSGMTHFTHHQSWIGTPSYMAPEQADGGSLEVDERTDIYALGCILYELVTGLPPLEKATGESRRGDIQNYQVIPPSKAPEDLRKIILKALSKKPDERYSDAGSLAADLNRFLEGQPLEAAPRSHSLPFILAALAITSCLVYWAWPSNNSKPGEPPKEEISFVEYHPSRGGPFSPFFNREGTRALGVFRNGGRSLLTDPGSGELVAEIPSFDRHHSAGGFSVSGSQFYLGHADGTVVGFDSRSGQPTGLDFQANPGQEGHVRLIREVDIGRKGKPILISHSHPKPRILAWDTSGKYLWRVTLPLVPEAMLFDDKHTRLAMGSPDGTIMLVNLEDQSLIPLKQNLTGRINGFDTLANNEGFTFSAVDGSVGAWDWTGRNLFFKKVSSASTTVSASPVDPMIAVGNRNGIIHLIDPRSGKLIREIYNEGAIWSLDFSPDGKSMVAGCLDDTVRFWNAETGKPLRPDWKIGEKVWGSRFAPDPASGLVVVTTTANKGMRVATVKDLP